LPLDPIVLNGVALRYGQGPDILSDITISLSKGSFHFLTGPSGAGKTSLLSLLYLAKRPTRGSVWLFGTDASAARREELPNIRRRLGVIFQDFRLLDHLSAFDNVALPLRIAGLNKSEVQSNVTEILSWVGLSDYIEARPPVLSGGQKQLVAIARAVVNRPQIILADEPTGSVDDKTANRLMQLFVELNKLGACVLIATHNEGLVNRFSFPRLHLNNGKLEQVTLN